MNIEILIIKRFFPGQFVNINYNGSTAYPKPAKIINEVNGCYNVDYPGAGFVKFKREHIMPYYIQSVFVGRNEKV